VEVDADDGIGAEGLGLVLQLAQGFAARVAQGPLLGAGAAADDVANAGEQILEDVGTDDDFADNDAEVFAGGPALDRGSSGDDHAAAPVPVFQCWWRCRCSTSIGSR